MTRTGEVAGLQITSIGQHENYLTGNVLVHPPTASPHQAASQTDRKLNLNNNTAPEPEKGLRVHPHPDQPLVYRDGLLYSHFVIEGGVHAYLPSDRLRRTATAIADCLATEADRHESQYPGKVTGPAYAYEATTAFGAVSLIPLITQPPDLL